MAKGAIQRIARRRVGRGRGLVVVRQMARLTGWVGQRIVVVDVARGAGDAHVRPRQGEPSGSVIENGAGPTRRIVASLASGGESGRSVWRSGRPVVVCLVAAITIGRGIGEIPVQVAGGTWHCQMKAR